MSIEPIRIMGVQGSPYSRKLRAVLRFRRVPHLWITQGSPESRTLPQPRVHLLPQLFLPGENGALEARVDSSPLIRLLEEIRAGRSVIPDDPVVRFLDQLLEDYADEWLTKAMFHYRWAFPADVANAAAILPRWFRTDQPDEKVDAAGKEFAARQVGRLGVVGSNETTAPIIEDGYRRLLKVLDAHLATSPFVLGSRPGAADFGLYGQLTQLAGFDPTPMAIARETAPRVVAWVDLVDDLSGTELESREWVQRDAVPDGVRALLREVGRVYVPFLLANAAALERAAESVECEIDGRRWVQRPFPYQEKCLRWLREDHAALDASDRAAVDAVLEGTGCEALFAS
ncbi:MAG: glutathione S-transferase family protein [Deltaproteobacteria bacterium]|nr:glutathione S-transferase family protein [Deltaproteobacteria bacterium]